MRKYLSLILLIVIFTPVLVSAEVPPCPPKKVCLDNPLKSDNFKDLVEAIIRVLFYIAISIAPIMFIVAGFYYLTAAGDIEKINTAKKIILYTLIGLVVIISASGIMELFQEIFVKELP